MTHIELMAFLILASIEGSFVSPSLPSSPPPPPPTVVFTPMASIFPSLWTYTCSMPLPLLFWTASASFLMPVIEIPLFLRSMKVSLQLLRAMRPASAAAPASPILLLTRFSSLIVLEPFKTETRVIMSTSSMWQSSRTRLFLASTMTLFSIASLTTMLWDSDTRKFSNNLLLAAASLFNIFFCLLRVFLDITPFSSPAPPLVPATAETPIALPPCLGVSSSS
mmetsp:Transcript_2098/g.4251  ORF Transcript_2098/g.4251 Transcript_2098/m.4251 type:complete len:222 (+) Transcript_2098:248-913(+)